jgi:hypothetical protein
MVGIRKVLDMDLAGVVGKGIWNGDNQWRKMW